MRSVSIAIILDKYDNMLMGKRKDNGKWTNPGGSVDEGENPSAACARELIEETGLTASNIDLVRSGYDSKKDIMIYIYKVQIKDIKDLDISKDPDNEMSECRFIDPFSIIDNLHISANANWALEWWANNKI